MQEVCVSPAATAHATPARRRELCGSCEAAVLHSACCMYWHPHHSKKGELFYRRFCENNTQAHRGMLGARMKACSGQAGARNLLEQ